MSKLDFLIVIFYMLGMIGIGYFLGKENKDQEDYFLAGRSMPVSYTHLKENGKRF